MNAFHPSPVSGLCVHITEGPTLVVLPLLGWVEARDFDVKGGENLLIPVGNADLVVMEDGWVERILDSRRIVAEMA